MEKLKTSVFIATSLDGYIARLNGELDWLDAANATVTPGEDCGYYTFMESVDAVVMGRNTFDKVRTLGDWHYEKKVFVLSSVLKTVPDDLVGKVEILSGSPKEVVDRIRSAGFKNLYIDGGLTICQFLREELVTDITLTVIPIILGSGIPLFSQLSKDISLRLTNTKSYDFGFVQSSYEVLV